MPLSVKSFIFRNSNRGMSFCVFFLRHLIKSANYFPTKPFIHEVSHKYYLESDFWVPETTFVLLFIPTRDSSLGEKLCPLPSTIIWMMGSASSRHEFSHHHRVWCGGSGFSRSWEQSCLPVWVSWALVTPAKWHLTIVTLQLFVTVLPERSNEVSVKIGLILEVNTRSCTREAGEGTLKAFSNWSNEESGIRKFQENWEDRWGP